MTSTTRRRKFFTTRTSVTLGLVIVFISIFTGYQTNQVYHLEVQNKIAVKQNERTESIRKVADYYMEQNPRLWDRLALYMAESTVEASEEYRVPLKLLVGVITKESEANPFAKSSTGAAGTSQVDFKAHVDTFPNLKSVRDRYDPKNNIKCGAYLLSDYIHKYGVKDGLHAYNMGVTAYKKGKRNPKYVRDVLSNASDFEFFRLQKES